MNTAIFHGSAVRELYRRSKGIPRLINVVADRALLAAYTQDRTRVDRSLVRRAAAEVFGRRFVPFTWPWAVAAAGIAAIALGTWGLLTERGAGEMVDETIAYYWRVRGVCVVDVAAEFRCHRSWPVVRQRMVAWLLRDEPEERLAA